MGLTEELWAQQRYRGLLPPWALDRNNTKTDPNMTMKELAARDRQGHDDVTVTYGKLWELYKPSLGRALEAAAIFQEHFNPRPIRDPEWDQMIAAMATLVANHTPRQGDDYGEL